MKFNLPTWLCVVLALVLVAFGLVFGTWSGYREDRADVTALLEADNGLMDVLSYRAADGLNLCVVARRHLGAEDDDVLALEQSARALQQSTDLAVRRTEDAKLTVNVADVSAKLNSSASFLASQRDQKYLEMLTADLSNLKGSTAVTVYNEAAHAFNRKLGGSLFGALASMLGVQACPVYQ